MDHDASTKDKVQPTAAGPSTRISKDEHNSFFLPWPCRSVLNWMQVMFFSSGWSRCLLMSFLNVQKVLGDWGECAWLLLIPGNSLQQSVLVSEDISALIIDSNRMIVYWIKVTGAQGTHGWHNGGRDFIDMERGYTVFSQTPSTDSLGTKTPRSCPSPSAPQQGNQVCLFCLFTLSFHFFPISSLITVFTSREWRITNSPKFLPSSVNSEKCKLKCKGRA